MQQDESNVIDCVEEPMRVQALHALLYCPRLFYLEEVERLRVADASVYAGRRLHAEIEREQGEDWQELFVESAELGMAGRMDALKTKDGKLIPYEHKRGRCCRDANNKPTAWNSDRVQVFAYALLLERSRGIKIEQCRVRYHADKVTVSLPFDESGAAEVLQALQHARELRGTIERPPIAENERLCAKCSLAPVCLPEEARLTAELPETVDEVQPERAPLSREPLRLFPADDERKTLHVLRPGAYVGRSGDRFRISYPEGDPDFVPVKQTGAIVLHGFCQISTQAIRFCADQNIGVHFLTTGGRFIGSVATIGSGAVQRKLRQYQALSDPPFCLDLAKRLVHCKGDIQRQILMRASRKENSPHELIAAATQIKALQKRIDAVESLDSLRGFEGSMASSYFGAFRHLLSVGADSAFEFDSRNRRPPKDRVNALLSFGYAQLLADVSTAILTVGLEPAIGFFHTPRSQAAPLALDLIELFRQLLVDIPVLNSLNRSQWEEHEDFDIAGDHVWLSDAGKRKFFKIYERRKQETWKHPVIGYSLSYGRMIELEVRLLEKEWMNEGGLFAQIRIR
jgi:CRISPR-associated protein Cas1